MRRIVACLVFASFTAVEIGAKQPVRAKHAMVAAQEGLATDVGVAVLKSGGNAIDAAVADRVRDGGDLSVRGQYRRRRIHDHPHGRRPHHLHRLPRARAGQGIARHVSRRERKAHAR